MKISERLDAWDNRPEGCDPELDEIIGDVKLLEQQKAAIEADLASLKRVNRALAETARLLNLEKNRYLNALRTIRALEYCDGNDCQHYSENALKGELDRLVALANVSPDLTY